MKIIATLFFCVLNFITYAQKTYTTKSAKITFFSHTKAEDIKATNAQVESKMIDKTGLLSFAVLIKGFKFENALMQQHFNEKDYMNSDKFSKATYTGAITNIATVNFAKNGVYPITSQGNITIHGVSQAITATGTITIAKGQVSIKSVFKIQPINFGINSNDIAKDIEITLAAIYK
jgi:YceI-like domain